MKSLEQENSADQPFPAADVETIMAHVREKMQENRRAALAQGLKPRQFVFADYPEEPTSGNYDVDLYVHLHQVNQPHQILGVRRVMRSSFLTRLPLLGSIWQRIQRESHDLVIFYVSSLAEELVVFQRHVANVLNRLVGWSQTQDIELRLLREEVKALKERLDVFEDRNKMRVAFVIPRYGPDILGGAESLTRGFAERLVQQGWSVEVWTTCARDYHLWHNVYPVGAETIQAVIVRRFPTRVNRLPRDNNTKVFGNFPDTPEAEYGWVDEGMHSPQLYHYLLQHGESFDHLIFIPYPFGFTCYSASIYPERSIIWPCLHDDAVAYFEPVRVMLNRARGIILNSNAEKRLLCQRLQVKNPHCQVIGYGLEATAGVAQRFYERYPHLKAPFILYAGRLEKSKNVHLMIDYFLDYVQTYPNGFNLLFIGSGPVVIPSHPRLFHLGYLSEEDKHDAYAAATVLCQPSVYESFGITLMEAWVNETPVLVHRACQVTMEHCLSAQAGLYFSDEFEFKGALDFLLTHPDIAAQLGQRGRIYVEANYNWPHVIKKLGDTLEAWRVV